MRVGHHPYITLTVEGGLDVAILFRTHRDESDS